MAPFRRTAARAGPAPQTSQTAQAPQAQPAQPDVILDQDPTQPVARVDGNGQPEQPQQPEQQPQLRTGRAACRSPALRTAQRGADQARHLCDRSYGTGSLERPQPGGRLFQRQPGGAHRSRRHCCGTDGTARDRQGGRSQEGRTCRRYQPPGPAVDRTYPGGRHPGQHSIVCGAAQRPDQRGYRCGRSGRHDRHGSRHRGGRRLGTRRGDRRRSGCRGRTGRRAADSRQAHRGLPRIAADVPPRLACNRGLDPCPAGFPLRGPGRLRPTGADHHGAARADAGRSVLRSFLWSGPAMVLALMLIPSYFGASPYGWGYPYGWGPGFGVAW